jgi:hypothetical protein
MRVDGFTIEAPRVIPAIAHMAFPQDTLLVVVIADEILLDVSYLVCNSSNGDATE